MSFHSFQYMPFLALCVVVYFLTPYRLRWVVLLTASYLFYAAWRLEFLSLIIISTLTDYVAGLRIEAARSEQERKWPLAVSLLVNLGLLFFFKYTSTLLDVAGSIYEKGFSSNAPEFTQYDILLPLGISFYTFQTLSYTIDVYCRRIPAEPHLGRFALYVAFFPQLLAGPIERAGHLLGELRARRDFDWVWIGPALFLIILGLAKKLVIADRLARILAPIIADPLSFTPVEVLLASPATVYQYYCDLSGYADIALGSAMLFGIRLSRNFDRPFASISTIRFWQRWHITVTMWFRDYLLRPLVKRRGFASSRPVAMMITGLMIGLWHAPTLGWLIAGSTVGLLATAEAHWSRWRNRTGVGPRTGTQKFAWEWAGRLYVWFIVFYLIGLPLTWGDIGTLGQVVGHIATLPVSELLVPPPILSVEGSGIRLLLVSIILLETWQWLEARGLSGRMVRSLGPELRWLSAAAFALFVLIFADLNQSGFLYFKF